MMDEKDQKKLLRRQRDWDKLEQGRRDDAVKQLLQTVQGRAYLYWLLELGKALGQNPFTGHALSTSFGCGEQNVGQQIMAHLIDVAPDGFLMVLKEKADERTNRDPRPYPDSEPGDSSALYDDTNPDANT